MLKDALLDTEGIAIERADHITPDGFPGDLVKLQDYDAVILANVPRGAGGLSDDQQKLLGSLCARHRWWPRDDRRARGVRRRWLAGEASSKRCCPSTWTSCPASGRQGRAGSHRPLVRVSQRQLLGRTMCHQSLETLNARDDIGVITFGWQGGGSGWDYPLAEKGDGTQVVAAIKQMQVGDMPSFDDSMNVAAQRQRRLRRA